MLDIFLSFLLFILYDLYECVYQISGLCRFWFGRGVGHKSRKNIQVNIANHLVTKYILAENEKNETS